MLQFSRFFKITSGDMHRVLRRIYMYLSIDHIEGIGPGYQEKLEYAGIKTVSDFLAVTRTQDQRDELSHRCKIPVGHINRWASMVDLARVEGVGFQYAELLTQSGVTSVEDLRKRNSTALREIMLRKNNKGKHFTNHVPTAALIDKFIANSRALTNILSI